MRSHTHTQRQARHVFLRNKCTHTGDKTRRWHSPRENSSAHIHARAKARKEDFTQQGQQVSVQAGDRDVIVTAISTNRRLRSFFPLFFFHRGRRFWHRRTSPSKLETLSKTSSTLEGRVRRESAPQRWQASVRHDLTELFPRGDKRETKQVLSQANNTRADTEEEIPSV